MECEDYVPVDVRSLYLSTLCSTASMYNIIQGTFQNKNLLFFLLLGSGFCVCVCCSCLSGDLNDISCVVTG